MSQAKDLIISSPYQILFRCYEFVDDLKEIHREKIQKYKTDLKTEKFLNEFKTNYEKGLICKITDYISNEIVIKD
jgi:hypothetical protein